MSRPDSNNFFTWQEIAKGVHKDPKWWLQQGWYIPKYSILKEFEFELIVPQLSVSKFLLNVDHGTKGRRVEILKSENDD